VAYFPVTFSDFINYDDPEYITNNYYVQQGLQWSAIRWAFTAGYASNWHPLTWISHMLDCQLFGMNPHAHHSVNLAFHILNAVLLLLLLERMTGQMWRSAVVAGLFALHPLHVESVAWISERKDVLSAFFFMLTLGAYVRYVEESKVHSPQSKVFYSLSLLAFACGLMSKPMLVTLPFLLLLIDFWPLARFSISDLKTRRTVWVRLVLEKVPFFILSIAASVVTFLVQRSGGAVQPFETLPFSLRAANAIVACVKYLAKSVWPADLAPFYPYPDHVSILQISLAVAAIAGLTALVLVLADKRPCVAVGWLWFLGSLVPVIGLVQVGGQSMADRYTYIPSIGLFIALVWGIRGRFPPSRDTAVWAGIASGIVLLGLGALTRVQAGYWKNSETLFRHALAVTGDNPVMQSYLGGVLVDEGKTTEGIVHLQEALRLNPAYAQAHGKLALAFDIQGRIPEALLEYHAALKWQPNLTEAQNNLAWLLATGPDPKFRNGAEAVTLAARACSLTDHHRAIYIGTLAAAYAEAGHFNDAVATAQEARAVALARGQKELANTNEKLESLYQSGRAYHQEAKTAP
jgi:hypothetical protein